jgi:FtsZ-binding cell division protein ZapB
MIGWAIFIGVVVLIAAISSYVGLQNRVSKLENENNDLRNDNRDLRQTISDWESYSDKLKNQERHNRQQKAVFNKLLTERTKNFPLVGQVWSQLIKVTE